MCSIYLYINMLKCDVKSISRTVTFIFFLLRDCFSQLSASIIYLFIVFFLWCAANVLYTHLSGLTADMSWNHQMSRNSLIIYNFHILTFLQMLLQLSRLSMIEKDINNKSFSHPSFLFLSYAVWFFHKMQSFCGYTYHPLLNVNSKWLSKLCSLH
jgi:hypothetical protein